MAHDRFLLLLGVAAAVASALSACASGTEATGASGGTIAGPDASVDGGAWIPPEPPISPGEASEDAAAAPELTDAASLGACGIPAAARPVRATYTPVRGACTAGPTGKICIGDQPCKPLCRPGQYEVDCDSTEPFSAHGIPEPEGSLGCKAIPIPTPSDLLFYCCPCDDGGGLENDAGGSATACGDAGMTASDGCLCVDITAYDRSCASDSDCMQASEGRVCGRCNASCGGDVAINVREKSRYYAEVVDRVPAGNPPGGACHCPEIGFPKCVSGQCVMLSP